METTKNNSYNPKYRVFWAVAISSLIFALFIALRIFLFDDSAFGGNNSLTVALVLITFSVAMTAELMFLRRYFPEIVQNKRLFTFLCVIQLFFIITSVYIEEYSAYLLPATYAVVLVAVFLNERAAYVANAFMTIMLFSILQIMRAGNPQYIVSNLSFLLISYIIGSLLIFLLAGNTKRLSFFAISFSLNLLALPVFYGVSYVITGGVSLINEALPYIAANIFLSVFLVLLLQPVCERAFNLITNYRLVELTDHNQPLLARLSDEAPGTFNHSLTVASLAETCARAIGENVYLTRACAYYHDAGKLKAPSFFGENQAGAYNPHDELTPEMSAAILTKHPIDGYEICRSYGLPEEICRTAREHHGTLPAYYFYSKAMEFADGRFIDIGKYSYAGPKPSSRISALIMICDACEAAVRSMEKYSAEAVDETVKAIIDSRLSAGQFDDCELTSRDLAVIRNTIVNAFCGLYHQRISYKQANK